MLFCAGRQQERAPVCVPANDAARVEDDEAGGFGDSAREGVSVGGWGEVVVGVGGSRWGRTL